MQFERESLERLRLSLVPLGAFAWRLLLAATLARLALVAWQWDRVEAADMLAAVFVQGLRFDVVLLGIILAIPVLLYPLLASTQVTVRAWRGFLRVYLPAMLIFVVFMECSTPSFVDQFDSRPNILFVEYLDHPVEVASTLFAAYKWPLAVTTLLIVFLSRRTARRFTEITRPIRATGVMPALVVTPLLLVLCVAGIRSTLDHRPVNPSTVALSTDPLVNDLALNSTYTLLYAIYETRHEAEGGFRYAELDEKIVVDVVREAMMVEPHKFLSGDLPTLHRQDVPERPGRPMNLVIILEESLGAEFVGSLGGLPLTPNLDEFSTQGIWLTQLYATGVRSVRGLEAVVAGFTPTPARSVVKLGKSQRNFFTLAELLKRSGYSTSFLYGGEAQFDNMRRFFTNNGFEHIVDKSDFADPVFTGSWGASDEDLFRMAHEEFSAAGDRPFFSLVFTSSNHSPYEFPDGRIELYDEQKATVNNAVKYADFALGQFLRQARDADYWQDTVFLVVADHNSRVYGDELVPIERFHIPGLILGGPIQPGIIDTVASQIDLGPTLLSMIGVSSEHPMIGRDLTDERVRLSPGRAIMQYNSSQAYMEGNHVAILQKDLPVQQYDLVHGHLQPAASDDEKLVRRALSHALWSSLAYERSLYRLPGTNSR
jgi:phosphoglycerol transferase MdoB-like AlkP superfamily enzyme